MQTNPGKLNNNMRKLMFICGLLPLCLFSAGGLVAASTASHGTVVKRISSCDYFMVSALNGYAVLEWYGGHDPDTGDILIGRFEEYGMHDILDDSTDETITTWTKDYGVSRTRALEILVDKCGD